MKSDSINICPGCGYEYESWVEVCPDCNLRVESRLRSEMVEKRVDPGDDPQWTVVANVPNAIIGAFIKSQLEDADIPVLMFRSPSADIAQFSHNDYVPQDIRVPRHLVEDARRLIDSAPDMADATGSLNSGPELYGGSSYGPQGWTLLTRNDRDARPGPGPEAGWRWSDSEEQTRSAPDESREASASSAIGEQEREDEAGYAEYEEEIEYEYNGDQPNNSPNWIRIFYGILLAAISLPFILQLLQQIAAIFGGPPR